MFYNDHQVAITPGQHHSHTRQFTTIQDKIPEQCSCFNVLKEILHYFAYQREFCRLLNPF